MQGLFGRFGKKHPEPTVSPGNPLQNGTSSQFEIDDREFAISSSFDLDDEETNWDDPETLADENNPVVYAQPIVPVVTPPIPTIPDLDNWDEALPAATVKNSNIQEVRRGKNPIPAFVSEDIWDDNIPSQTFSSTTSLNPSAPSNVNRAVGFWTSGLRQFRRFLPAPIRRLSDPILTVIVIAFITISIWFIDGFFIPGVKPSVANPPATSIDTQPIATTQVSPEQDFIEAIQTQLSDLTSQYPDEIIQTLNVDLARDRLIVQLNPVWYTIDEDRQNSLTDRLWLQAKENHFTKLEIQDSQGVAIARSPVVGKHPIILQRRQGP
jgi:hypothetical protein